MVQPTVLMTGASGGLGGATARLFAARGWTVFAADLTPVQPGANIVPLSVDVTSQDSVDALIEAVASETTTLDAVIPFAGVLGIGPLADGDPDKVKRVLDVNVLGVVRVVCGAFDLLRRPGGRVVVIGSETGPQHGMPLNGAYGMSKHAIEAYADSLRRELTYLGIDVVLVQPGPFRSGMTSSIMDAFDRSAGQGSPFRPLALAMGVEAAKADHTAGEPGILAEAVWRATTGRPRHRIPVRWDATRRLLDKLPVPWVDALLKARFEKSFHADAVR